MKSSSPLSLKKEFSKVAEIDLIYRSKVRSADRPSIQHAKEAYSVFINTWDMDKIELQEQFRIMFLDQKSSCLGVTTLSTGGIAGCVVDLRLAFGMALKVRASSILIAHNHPSGNLLPSRNDEKLTQKFYEAGQILDLPLADHLIVTREGFYSFSEHGMGGL